MRENEESQVGRELYASREARNSLLNRNQDNCSSPIAPNAAL
jgi:hypothetical protein